MAGACRPRRAYLRGLALGQGVLPEENLCLRALLAEGMLPEESFRLRALPVIFGKKKLAQKS